MALWSRNKTSKLVPTTAVAHEPELWITSITLSDGQRVDLEQGDVLVIVGPNNAGKSAALRDIELLIADKKEPHRVVTQVTLHKSDASGALGGWLRRIAAKTTSMWGNPSLTYMGAEVEEGDLDRIWKEDDRLARLTRFFVNRLGGEERLSGSRSVTNTGLREAPTHPIHYLYRNDELEKQLSAQFRQAFGADLIVHRAGGKDAALVVGDRPVIEPGDDRVSVRYLAKIDRLPLLDEQGDGMRSFATILLHTTVGPERVVMVDEPEAFLHPPQARLLGRMLVQNKARERQVVIATHSGDVLRGLLDADSARVRVIRLVRQGAVNRLHQLGNADVERLWGDSLLRYSNVLDGIFHQAVIVGESDSDARFYAAVLDALQDANPAVQRRDVMFTSAGGKARMPVVIRALRALGVAVTAVVDFDILSDELPLRTIVDAYGEAWESISRDWRVVHAAVNGKRVNLTTDEVKRDVDSLFKSITASSFPQEARKRLGELLKRTSPWAHAKAAGKAVVPSGDATNAYARLIDALNGIGIYVVEVGELERFVPTVGDHGSAWVARVLETKSLSTDGELAAARAFVQRIVKWESPRGSDLSDRTEAV